MRQWEGNRRGYCSVMYQQLQRERLPRRKCLCTQSKELIASTRRQDYPVCEDAESKRPWPVPVIAKLFTVFSYHPVCMHCFNTCFQKVPGLRVFHGPPRQPPTYQDFTFRLQGSCHPLSWEVKSKGFFNCDSCLDSLCSPRKKKCISSKISHQLHQRDAHFLAKTLKGLHGNKPMWRELYYLS